MSCFYKERRSMKRRGENKNYEPIYGSDIFNQLPSKNNKSKYKNDESKKYDLAYEGFNGQEYVYPSRGYSYNKRHHCNYDNNYNPFRTTYNSSYKQTYVNGNKVVGINKDIGTGVAYNSRKQKIDFLKSNIFCDEDKYKQNTGLIDNFDPKLINHNNWYTNLDWRFNKSELVFYKQNQREFYDNTSTANKNSFETFK